MVVIYCYLKKENYKVLKIPVNNYSYFQISGSLFSVPSANKRRALKLQNQIRIEGAYYRKYYNSSFSPTEPSTTEHSINY